MARPRSYSNATRNSIGSSSSHSTALNSPPSSPPNRKLLKAASSSLSLLSSLSSSSHSSSSSFSTTTTATSHSRESARSYYEKNIQQQPKERQRPQTYDTAIFEGKELRIVTAEPVWDRVPDSQVVQADIIMPWHPSHSSQREIRRCKAIVELASRTTRKRKKKRPSIKTNRGNRSSSCRHNRRESSTKETNSRNSSSWHQVSRHNLNQIALHAVALLVLVLMIVLYLDNDDSDQHLSHDQHNIGNAFPNPPHRPTGRGQRSTQRNSPSNTNENNIPKFLSLENTANSGIENNNGIDNHNTTQLVMISGDYGVPIRYDFWNQKCLVTFRRMISRAQNAERSIRTIANTEKQFVLAVDGEERPRDGGSSPVEILLCNKPSLQRTGGDATANFFFDDRKENCKSTESTTGSSPVVQESRDKPARKKYTMAEPPIFDDGVVARGAAYNKTRSDHAKTIQGVLDTSHNDADADRQERGICIVAELRPHDGSFAIYPVNSFSRPYSNDYDSFDPGPRPERTAGSPYETQPYVPPQHLGASVF